MNLGIPCVRTLTKSIECVMKTVDHIFRAILDITRWLSHENYFAEDPVEEGSENIKVFYDLAEVDGHGDGEENNLELDYRCESLLEVDSW